MNKRFWIIVFILVIMQASSFGYVLNMNNRFQLLQEKFQQNNTEEIILKQQMLNQDIKQIIQVIRGLMIQVQHLTNENEKNKIRVQHHCEPAGGECYFRPKIVIFRPKTSAKKCAHVCIHILNHSTHRR